MAGRKRAPLAGTGEQAELAQRLRDLRDASGLTLRQLAGKSGYSAGALSHAESGRGVPSWELVAAFAQACGADPVPWRHQWELARAAPALPEHAVVPMPAAPSAVPPQRAHPLRPRSGRHLIAGAAVAVITASVAVLVWPIEGRAHHATLATAEPPARAASVARDDTDPYADGCKPDEKRLDAQPVYRENGKLFGTIFLVYSRACQAEWGYLTAPNSTRWTIHINTYRIPGNSRTQWHFSSDEAIGSWGNVLSTKHGCVYAEAYVTDQNSRGPQARTACIQP